MAVAQSEANGLKQKGITVKLHVIYNDSLRNAFSWKKLIAGINIFWSFSSYGSIKKIIKSFKPDIVHFHGVLPLLTPSAFYACKRMKVPVIQTLHNFRWVCVEGGLFRNNSYCERCLGGLGWQGFFYGCSRDSRLISLILWIINLFYIRTGLIYKLVDNFITVSEFVKNKHIEAGLRHEKLVVKYNSAPNVLKNIEEVNKSNRRGISIIGRLAPAKGTKIIKKIILQKDIQFDIVGIGPDFQELKQYSKKNKLYNVKFWGQIAHERVLQIISSSKCVIIPSVCGEAFPCVALEAMACGIPLIGSKLGGIVELVNNSNGGVLADPDNVDTFISAIYELSENSEKILKMGNSGLCYVMEKLSNSHIVDQLITIYQNVINR